MKVVVQQRQPWFECVISPVNIFLFRHLLPFSKDLLFLTRGCFLRECCDDDVDDARGVGCRPASESPAAPVTTQQVKDGQKWSARSVRLAVHGFGSTLSNRVNSVNPGQLN
ncbi:hypothetical protein HanRHA438_Chr02g0047961 [Helianthus annuus]|nr:hypothetical protein HanRHA438_Chr02g0047961 [Helianthus annuus]